jgi:AraC-like DNA-binding protein
MKRARFPFQTPPRFEQILPPENESFLWRIDDYPWARSVWNSHPEYEVHLIRRSHGTAFIGDYIGDFSPGHLTVIGSWLPHNWVSHIEDGEIIQSRDLILQFDPEILRKTSAFLPEIRGLEKFLTIALRGALFTEATAGAGQEMLEAIGASRGTDRLGRFMSLMELFASSTSYEVLSSSEFSPDRNPEALDIMQRALCAIHDNFDENLFLSDIADNVGMSESTFSRFFKKNAGRSFTDYVIELRIGRACRLLSETRQTISEICFTVGFSNLSNFNKHFLRQRGKTPSEYRKMALGKWPEPSR